jgi:hypothetical protein
MKEYNGKEEPDYIPLSAIGLSKSRRRRSVSGVPDAAPYENSIYIT